MPICQGRGICAAASPATAKAPVAMTMSANPNRRTTGIV
jgi:hypothetical protein